MRQFVFALESLFQVKQTIRDKLQAEYAAAQAALAEAEDEKARLDRTLAEESGRYARKARTGTTVGDFEAHAIYFEELQRMISAAGRRVDRAREEAVRRQTALVEVHKEIKVLEKLRRKRHLEHRAEEARRELGVREDILSFHLAGGADTPGRPAGS